MRPNAPAAAAAAVAALALAAAAACPHAAADSAGALAAYAQVPGADPVPHGLAGMRLDGLSGGGHAVLLEFAARGDGSSADADGRPLQRPSLERGWARTASGLHALGGGGGASVMVTGGGSIAVHSAGQPAVVFAVPAKGGGGMAGDRYAVTVHAPDGEGGFETTIFEAVLGAAAGNGGGAGNGSAAGAAPDPNAAAGGGAGAPAAGGMFPDALALAVTITDRVQFGGTLVVQGRVYDASINADPRVVPRGPGAVPGVPVEVAVTDKRTGQVVLDWAGRADAAGLFRAEHGWSNTDPASSLAVSISVDGGRLVEERTAFYMGR